MTQTPRQVPPRSSQHALMRRYADVALMKVVTTFYRRMVLVSRDLSGPLPEVSSCSLPVKIKKATEEDLPAYRAFHPGRREGVIQARFARGDECFAVWDEGHIVHAAWVAAGRAYVPYLHRDLLLQPDEMYIYDSFTRPSHRRRGLCGLRGRYLLRHYHARGYKRALGLVALENKTAFAPVRSVGYTHVGMYTCVRLGPWQWHWQRAFGNGRLPALAPRQA